MIVPFQHYGEALADYVTRLEAETACWRLWVGLVAASTWPGPLAWTISLLRPPGPSPPAPPSAWWPSPCSSSASTARCAAWVAAGRPRPTQAGSAS